MPSEPNRSSAAQRLASESEPKSVGDAAPKSVFREYGEALFVALLLALFIRTFVVQAFKIPSGSMLPTLQIGDHILVNKFVYGVRLPFLDAEIADFGDPSRGDVVVFVYPEDPQKDFIKRVVAVGGDTVEVRDKRLLVNGEAVSDPYATYAEGLDGVPVPTRDQFGPFAVPPGEIFVMGDNRDRSYDSRFWGPVKVDHVKGKAFLIYWSWNGPWTRPHVRWERIGHLIH